MSEKLYNPRNFKKIAILCGALFLCAVTRSDHTDINLSKEHADHIDDITIPSDTLHILRNPQQLMDSLEFSKGFSLNMQHPEAQRFLSCKDSLYMVSPYPEKSEIFPGGVTLEQIMKFKEKNNDLLLQRNHILGGWRETKIDSITGKHSITDYLDVSIGEYDKEKALSIARVRGQLAIYFPPTRETMYIIVSSTIDPNK